MVIMDRDELIAAAAGPFRDWQRGKGGNLPRGTTLWIDRAEEPVGVIVDAILEYLTASPLSPTADREALTTRIIDWLDSNRPMAPQSTVYVGAVLDALEALAASPTTDEGEKR